MTDIWPEDEGRTRSRVAALVSSLVRDDELQEMLVETSTRSIWLTIRAGNRDIFEEQIWIPDGPLTWEDALAQLADRLEDWICETAFAWGEQRRATLPD